MRTQLAIRTEYSFRYAYGPVERVVQRLKELGCETAAITDRNSTYGHVNWTKYCKKYGIKPIYGVELGFVEDINAKGRRQNVFWLPLLARNNDGLREIYAAVEEATHNFYYFPRLPFKKLNDISKNVIIFTGNSGLGQRARLGRNVLGSGHPATANAILKDRTVIPVSDNFMITHEDKSIYEILAGRNTNDRPSPTYILDEWMLRLEMDWLDDEHFNLADKIGAECDAQIQIAPNIKYKSNMSLLDMCLIGARERELELTDEYMERLNKELGLIVEKGFEDYFYVIADMVTYAKKHMLVGPARGSSCGSLVCYLLGITDVDPIPFGLIFERFIDITRSDLPDIDIDFQDNRRDVVFEYIRDKYGADCVAHLGTVSRYKPKSAIGESAKALGIPEWEIKDLKDSILKRSGGDSRAKYCIMDTFQELEIGQRFIEKYPQMKIAGDLEGHARHTGKHAAAIIISNKPLSNYTAFDAKNNTIHIDKFDTEYLNMMKIDALGLKTLTILRETMDEVGWTHKDLLKHPLDDDKAFEVLRKHLFCGIFQFEGQALQTLARRLHIDRFNDVAILTALARPGPFASGASANWIECRNGRQEPKFIHPSMESYTKETYGIIIYQEQVMKCVREIGQFSWGDTSEIRKAISKSLGIEYFDRYWQKFKEGAAFQGIDETYAKTMWDNINTMGSWAFNKSHAIAYGMLSYWCCVLKAHFPVEFALATIRNTGDPDSIKRYLRELDRTGYQIKAYDLDSSEKSWSFKDNTFIGGLLNIKGVGYKKADNILLARALGQEPKFPDTIETPYDNLFEGRTRFADVINDPLKYNIVRNPRSDLIDVDEDYQGDITFMAKIVHRNERSLNETMFLAQRDGVRVPNDKWLNLTLEDDTSSVIATVSRYSFPSLGLKLINDYRLGSWFIWGGYVNKGRRIYIKKFRYLG